MTITQNKNSAFILDDRKAKSFLSRKPSKRDEALVKSRADALRKILKDETKRK